LAHGTPDTLDEMPGYLTRVRGGRPPEPVLLEEMRRNYAAIGGRSPLTDITRAQAAALAREIDRPVYVGMRNWHPLVASALAHAMDDGIRHLQAIPMAPQYSTLSVAKYQEAVEQARPEAMSIAFVESWDQHPFLLQAFAEKLEARLAAGPWDRVLFTAHSLPARVVAGGDPYPEHVRATAAGVAARVGLGPPHIAYQSAGRTPEPWIGPSVEQVLSEAAAAGVRRVLLVPIGFVCDHTEILYDLDIAAAAAAHALGLTLGRTESLNTSPALIHALADLVGAQ